MLYAITGTLEFTCPTCDVVKVTEGNHPGRLGNVVDGSGVNGQC